MDRIWHHWNRWECYKSNFYGSLSKDLKKQEATNLCVELYSDSKEFKRVLNLILNEWKYSCEHNLSNIGMNRIAWSGQAACAYKFNIPNLVSMRAFNEVDLIKQEEANRIAQDFIEQWERKYVQS